MVENFSMYNVKNSKNIRFEFYLVMELNKGNEICTLELVEPDRASESVRAFELAGAF